MKEQSSLSVEEPPSDELLAARARPKRNPLLLLAAGVGWLLVVILAVRTAQQLQLPARR